MRETRALSMRNVADVGRTLGTRLPFDWNANENKIFIERTLTTTTTLSSEAESAPPTCLRRKTCESVALAWGPVDAETDSYDVSAERIYYCACVVGALRKGWSAENAHFKMPKRPIKRVGMDSIFPFQTVAAAAPVRYTSYNGVSRDLFSHERDGSHNDSNGF